MKYLPLLFLMFFSCKSPLNITEVEKEAPVIIIKKTSCKGKCPVYEAFFYKEGVIIINAKENFKVIGKYYKEIGKSAVKDLVKDFNRADFFNFEDKYISKKTDLPTTFVTFNFNGKSKRVMDYSDAPRKLNELENKLKAFIESGDWLKME